MDIENPEPGPLSVRCSLTLLESTCLIDRVVSNILFFSSLSDTAIICALLPSSGSVSTDNASSSSSSKAGFFQTTVKPIRAGELGKISSNGLVGRKRMGGLNLWKLLGNLKI